MVRRIHPGHGSGVVDIASRAACEHRLRVCVYGGFTSAVEGFQGVFGGFAAEGVRTRGQGVEVVIATIKGGAISKRQLLGKNFCEDPVEETLNPKPSVDRKSCHHTLTTKTPNFATRSP